MNSFYKLFNGEYPDQTPKNTDNKTSAKLIVQDLLISSYFCTFIV